MRGLRNDSSDNETIRDDYGTILPKMKRFAMVKERFVLILQSFWWLRNDWNDYRTVLRIMKRFETIYRAIFKNNYHKSYSPLVWASKSAGSWWRKVPRPHIWHSLRLSEQSFLPSHLHTPSKHRDPRLKDDKWLKKLFQK